MSTRGIAHHVLHIAPIVLLARGAGFALIALIAASFGAQGETDAFFVAFAVAVVLQFIIATGIATVATPIMAELKANAPHQLAEHSSSIAIFSSGLAGTGACIAYLALEPLLRHLALLTPSTRALASWYALCMIPFVILSTTNAVLKATTEIQERFSWAAAAPLARTLTAIAIVLFGQGKLDTGVLPLAYILGALCELALYVLLLAHLGTPIRPRVQLSPAVRQTVRNAAPILVGQSLMALIPLVDRLYASSLDTGAVSTLDYADRIRWIPQQFVEFTLVPVAFATWSHGVASGDFERYARQLHRAISWVAGLVPPALFGIYVFRFILIEALFQRGAFTADDTVRCAEALSGYLPGLCFAMLGGLAMRAHVIEGRLRWVMAMGAVSLILKVFANAAFIGLGLLGLSLASTTVWFIVPSAHLFRLRSTLKKVRTKQTYLPLILLMTASLIAGLTWEMTFGSPRTMADQSVFIGFFSWLALQWCGLTLARGREPR